MPVNGSFIHLVHRSFVPDLGQCPGSKQEASNNQKVNIFLWPRSVYQCHGEENYGRFFSVLHSLRVLAMLLLESQVAL